MPFFFPRQGSGVSMNEIALSLGPTPCATQADHCRPIPPQTRHCRPAAGHETGSRTAVAEWETTGRLGCLVSRRCGRILLDRARRHAQSRHGNHLLSDRGQPEPSGINASTSIRHGIFDDPAAHMAPDVERVVLMANPVLPRSEGEIVLQSTDPTVHPDDPHELLRRSLRHEGHDGGGPPDTGHRGALARQPQGRPRDDPALPRRKARPRRRQRSPATQCWRISPCISP